jgi:hypothetical protein
MGWIERAWDKYDERAREIQGVRGRIASAGKRWRERWRRRRRSIGSARLDLGLPNGVFPVSCCLEPREDAES